MAALTKGLRVVPVKERVMTRYTLRVALLSTVFPVWLVPAGAFADASRSTFINNADLIVVGGADVRPRPDRSGPLVLTIHAARVPKDSDRGVVSPKDPILVVWEEAGSPAIDTEAPYGLWFLKWGDGGHWGLLTTQPHHLTDVPGLSDYFIPLPSGPLPPRLQCGRAEAWVDRMADELWAGILSGSDEMAASSYYVVALLFGTLPVSDPVAWAHIESIVPRHRAACPTERLRLQWGTLLADRIRRFPAASARTRAQADLLRALWDVNDEAALAALVRLQRSSADEDVRYGVGSALRNIHSVATLPYLAQLLDSPFAEVQYLGVMGFACLANNYPMGQTVNGLRRGGLMSRDTIAHHPDKPAFGADPERYVSFWKNWYLHGAGKRDGPAAPRSPD